MITAFCLLILALVPASPGTAQALPESHVSSASTPPLPQPSGIGIRLLDVPAATQTDPRARSYIVDRLAPGTGIHRRIQVQNNSTAAQSVRIYTGAAQIQEGSFVGDNDPAVNELTTWTSVDRPQVELPAGESADVLVTIDVPSDASEAEQYAAVWAEVRNAPAKGSNVVQASRVGIRIYLSVGPGNGQPADFRITSLTAARDAQGNPQVTAVVTNTGGRALDITGDLTLSKGPGGISAGPFSAQKALTLAPGKDGTVVTTLDPALPNGPWNAQLQLKSGLVEHEAAASITFPDSGQGETVEPAPEAGFPWIALGTGAAFLFIAAALLWWWLRRRNTADIKA
ncbi:COG1361 family protein [Arthrobacter sp. MDT3-24]